MNSQPANVEQLAEASLRIWEGMDLLARLLKEARAKQELDLGRFADVFVLLSQANKLLNEAGVPVAMTPAEDVS